MVKSGMHRFVGAILLLMPFMAISAELPDNAAAAADSVDELHYSYGDTGDSLVFDWRGAEQTIYYGSDSTYGRQATATSPAVTPVDNVGPFREVKLSGLQPGTSYHYKIGVYGLDHVMTTTPTGSFNWVDIGDTASTLCSPWMSQTQALVAAQGPTFVTHGGDVSYANECGPGAVHQYFVDQEAWSHTAAFQPVWGNHEYGAPNSESLPGAIRDSMANYKGRVYITNAQTVASDKTTQVNNPGCGWETGAKTNTCRGEDWGWFLAGHVLYISYPEPWVTAQVDWRTQAGALMASAQANPNIDFIVTYGHRPAYTSLAGGESTDLRSSINALAQLYSPTANNPLGKYVLNVGHHIHGEEVFAPINGLLNITNGGGGAGQTTFSVPGDPSSVYKTVHPGILSASYDVTSHSLSIRLLCGPDYQPNVKEHCTYGNVLSTTRFTRPNTLVPPVVSTAVSDGVGSVQAGQQVTYSLPTTNTQPGSSAVPGATLTAVVPANATVVDAGGGVLSGNVLSWNIGSLASGQQVSELLTLRVDSGTSLVVTTQLTTGDTSCTATGSVCAATDTDVVTPLPVPVPQVTVTDGVATVQPGQQTTYTITAADVGDASPGVSGAVVTVTVPADATIVDSGGGVAEGAQVRWSPGTLSAGQPALYQLTLLVPNDPSVEVDALLSTTDNSCGDAGSACSASDVDPVIVPQPATLTTTVTDGVTSVTQGQQTTYSVSVVNTQPLSVPASSVNLTAAVPPGATVMNAYGGTVSGNTVTWAVGDLASVQAATEQLTLAAGGGATMDVTVQATATDSSCSNAGSVCSATDSDVITPPPPAIVSASLTDNTSALQVGQQTTYTLAVSAGQPGSNPVTAVSLTATIPANATVRNSFGGVVTPTTVTWQIGTLTAGQAVGEQLTLQATGGTTLAVTAQVATGDSSCANPASSCTGLDTDLLTAPPPLFKQWVLNPGVETDLSGWTGKYGPSPYVVAARDTTVAHGGTASIKVSALSGAVNLSSGINDSPRWVLRTVAGTTYSQSAWVDATFAGQKISLRLREWNAAGTVLITDKVLTITATAPGWQQVSQTLTAAGSNDQIAFAVYAVLSAGQRFYVDDMSLTTPS